jgi:hypothetical protein
MRVSAFRTRSVAIGQCCRFIQEKQLGPSSRCHDLAVAPTELQAARDPAAHLPIAHDFPLGVVQDTAISRQRSSPRHRDNLAKRRDAVPQWHTSHPTTTPATLHRHLGFTNASITADSRIDTPNNVRSWTWSTAAGLPCPSKLTAFPPLRVSKSNDANARFRFSAIG